MSWGTHFEAHGIIAFYPLLFILALRNWDIFYQSNANFQTCTLAIQLFKRSFIGLLRFSD